MSLADAAAALRDLHHGPEMLVVPNAWDAASARRFERLGYPAVATTSAGVAEAIGYADHEAAPSDAMLAAVGRIAAAVAVPVTADLEAGYRLSSETLVESLLDAGAVGLNIEDSDHHADGGGLVDADQHAERLAAIKRAGRAAGVDVVLNARIDAYLHGGGVDEALRRARIYAAAGADCVYPIGAAAESDIAALVEGAGAPVNVFVRPGVPSRERLAELGVARATFGGGLFHAALERAEQVLREF